MFDKSTYFPQLGIFEAKQQLGSFAANHDFQHNGTFAIESSIGLSRNTFLGFFNKAAAD